MTPDAEMAATAGDDAEPMPYFQPGYFRRVLAGNVTGDRSDVRTWTFTLEDDPAPVARLIGDGERARLRRVWRLPRLRAWPRHDLAVSDKTDRWPLLLAVLLVVLAAVLVAWSR